MEESRSRLYGHPPAGCPKRRGAPKKLSPFAPGILHFQSVAGFCGAAKQPRLGLLPPDGNLTRAIHAPCESFAPRSESGGLSASRYNQNNAARQLWPSFPWCFCARCWERGSGSWRLQPWWRGVALPGLCRTRHALDPVGEIVSLSPPGRAGLIPKIEVTSYEASEEFILRASHSGSWRPT